MSTRREVLERRLDALEELATYYTGRDLEVVQQRINEIEDELEVCDVR